jgi:hypothetical protein
LTLSTITLAAASIRSASANDRRANTSNNNSLYFADQGWAGGLSLRTGMRSPGLHLSRDVLPFGYPSTDCGSMSQRHRQPWGWFFCGIKRRCFGGLAPHPD